MKVAVGAGFDQQRSVEDPDSNTQFACAILESPGRLGAHGRVQDPLECLPCIGIGKHDLAQTGPVDLAVLVEDGWTEV